MADQQFCLRWNNHQSTLVSVFDTLLENSVLVDCTLAAEGQSLKAHKVMLSACSPYLEHLLSQHYEKHPIIILKDVKFAELKSMIDYMYRGEVNISQDQLGTFLKAAESLQIKGLTDNNEGDARDVGSTSKAPPPPRKSTLPASSTPLAEPQRPDVTPASPGHRSRDGSISPTLRKRRRIRRHSQDDMGDNVLENSNSCDLPAQSTPIVPNIPLTSTTAPPMKATIVKPEQTELVNRIDTNLNSLPPESGLLKEKLEPEPLLLEPKTEYLDDNNDSVEDLTLDDDDDMDGMDVSQMSNLSNMSRPGPSHGNGNDLSNQGFAPWHNQSGTDEVFMAAQEAVNNAHRDSQVSECPPPEAPPPVTVMGPPPNVASCLPSPTAATCAICSKSFVTIRDQWEHFMYNCSGAAPEYHCPKFLCTFASENTAEIKSHIATMHDKQAKFLLSCLDY